MDLCWGCAMDVLQLTGNFLVSTALMQPYKVNLRSPPSICILLDGFLAFGLLAILALCITKRRIGSQLQLYGVAALTDARASSSRARSHVHPQEQGTRSPDRCPGCHRLRSLPPQEKPGPHLQRCRPS